MASGIIVILAALAPLIGKMLLDAWMKRETIKEKTRNEINTKIADGSDVNVLLDDLLNKLQDKNSGNSGR